MGGNTGEDCEVGPGEAISLTIVCLGSMHSVVQHCNFCSEEGEQVFGRELRA